MKAYNTIDLLNKISASNRPILSVEVYISNINDLIIIDVDERKSYAISWGDGKEDVINSNNNGNVQHFYDKVGYYNIFVMCEDNNAHALISERCNKYVYKIFELCALPDNVKGLFNNTTNLTFIKPDIFRRSPNIQTLTKSFNGFGMKHMTDDIFTSLPYLESIYNCFNGITTKTLPDNMFNSNTYLQLVSESFREAIGPLKIPTNFMSIQTVFNREIKISESFSYSLINEIGDNAFSSNIVHYGFLENVPISQDEKNIIFRNIVRNKKLF